MVWTTCRITLALAVVAALAAFSARETFRTHRHDLGRNDAIPVPKPSTTAIRVSAVRASA